MIAAQPPPYSVESNNWAGYTWQNGSSTSSEFTVPDFPWKQALSPQEKDNQNGVSIWTGIGGSVADSDDIEQTGIYDYVNGTVTGWYGFYELAPLPAVNFGGAISPGDDIVATVTRSGYDYTFTLQDKGPHHAWTVTITKAYDHTESYSEFMVEDYGTTYSPLTEFQPVYASVSGTPYNQYYSPWGNSSSHAGDTVEVAP